MSPVLPERKKVEEARDGLQDIVDAIEKRGSVADNLARVCPHPYAKCT
jgi:hypothetical protein